MSIVYRRSTTNAVSNCEGPVVEHGRDLLFGPYLVANFMRTHHARILRVVRELYSSCD
jgi:hypothetical protein